MLKELKYSLVAVPTLVVAAACGGKSVENQQGEAGGAISNPTIGRNIETIAPPTEVTSPTVITNAENFQGDAQVTLDQIEKLAQRLPDSIYKVDLLDYLNLAQDYQQEDPNNQDIYNSLDVSFQILNQGCTTDDHKSVARLIDQYVRDKNPAHYQAKAASLYSQGPCGSGLVETPEQTPETESEVASEPRPENTPEIGNGYAKFRERSHHYDLYTGLPLEHYADPNYIQGVFAHLNPAQLAGIQESMGKALEVKATSTQQAAKIISGEVSPQINAACPAEEFPQMRAQNYLQSIGGIVYDLDPKNWDNNKTLILENSCFWGKKFNVRTDYEIEDRDYGLFVYKGVTYNDLLLTENIGSVGGALPYESYQNVVGFVTRARDRAAIAPDDIQIMEDLLGAGLNLKTVCQKSEAARDYLRLIASVSIENFPEKANHIEHVMFDCDFFEFE